MPAGPGNTEHTLTYSSAEITASWTIFDDDDDRYLLSPIQVMDHGHEFITHTLTLNFNGSCEATIGYGYSNVTDIYNNQIWCDLFTMISGDSNIFYFPRPLYPISSFTLIVKYNTTGSFSFQDVAGISVRDVYVEKQCADFIVSEKILPEWSRIVAEPANSAPSGIWADFNRRYQAWKALHRNKAKRILWCDYMPEIPRVADYPDIESPGTL